ncbi:DNA polymerase III subunit epsilon [Buchnera aphidicola]|uniref:DNA polymerase III subunit epsilon n=1 Tax=Buchnera aphidicola TaxID=9 RepID=UPI003463FE4C
MDRKIVIDTETTGMNRNKKFYLDHCIIEIGAVEIINRELTGNNFHTYIQTNRLIDFEAFKIHGITNDFLMDKPFFYEIILKFIKYLNQSDIIMHNANFDLGFLNYEIQKLNKNIKKISEMCKVIDTLQIARSNFPGKKNNLDALRKRYQVNIPRNLHSAIIDAEILAKVYLRMTSVQKTIIFNNLFNQKNILKNNFIKNKKHFENIPPFVLKATKNEYHKHEKYLKNINKDNSCLWLKLKNII